MPGRTCFLFVRPCLEEISALHKGQNGFRSFALRLFRVNVTLADSDHSYYLLCLRNLKHLMDLLCVTDSHDQGVQAKLFCL